MGTDVMRQVAPYPRELDELVRALRYRRDRGWKVWLEDIVRDPDSTHAGLAGGLTLVVQRHGPDSYHPERYLAVNHYFIVPAATYNRASWTRWLFDQLGLVDDHERMEDFAFAAEHNIAPGGEADEVIERPYAPIHKPGHDPYQVHMLSTWAEVDTDFRGERVHPDASPDGGGQ